MVLQHLMDRDIRDNLLVACLLRQVGPDVTEYLESKVLQGRPTWLQHMCISKASYALRASWEVAGGGSLGILDIPHCLVRSVLGLGEAFKSGGVDAVDEAAALHMLQPNDISTRLALAWFEDVRPLVSSEGLICGEQYTVGPRIEHFTPVYRPFRYDFTRHALAAIEHNCHRDVGTREHTTKTVVAINPGEQLREFKRADWPFMMRVSGHIHGLNIPNLRVSTSWGVVSGETPVVLWTGSNTHDSQPGYSLEAVPPLIREGVTLP